MGGAGGRRRGVGVAKSNNTKLVGKIVGEVRYVDVEHVLAVIKFFALDLTRFHSSCNVVRSSISIMLSRSITLSVQMRFGHDL